MNQQTIDYAKYETLKKEHEQLINAILAYNEYLQQAKEYELAQIQKTNAKVKLISITDNHSVNVEILENRIDTACNFADAYIHAKRLLQEIIDAFQLDSNGES